MSFNAGSTRTNNGAASKFSNSIPDHLFCPPFFYPDLLSPSFYLTNPVSIPTCTTLVLREEFRPKEGTTERCALTNFERAID